jgi:AraC family transcriptional activator of pobA
MTLRRGSITRFGLYGERLGVIEPEFVHIETISARSSLHNWVIAPHVHPGIFQLLYLSDGFGWLAADGSEQRLDPPMLVVIPCGSIHGFRFTPNAQGWVLSIADSLASDPRLASLYGGAPSHGDAVQRIALASERQREDMLSALLSELCRRHGEAPGYLSASTMALIALLLTTVEEISLADPDETAGLNRRIALVRRFTSLVEQNYGGHWSVPRYASALGTTAPTLTRACREVTGKPPGRIALDRLLREAMRALSYSTAGINEISDDLGFSDPAYFARIFRKHVGMTATAFRRERVWPADRAKPADVGRRGQGAGP